MIQKSKLDFFAGETLKALAATYPTLKDVLCEKVQNPLDTNAKNIWMVVNLHKGFANIRDDGDGVSQVEFEKALSEIGKSQKSKGKLGRFGRGLISSLGKCFQFFFASCPKGACDNFKEWKFVTDELFSAKHFDGVPWRQRHDLYYGTPTPRGKTNVSWRTEVRIDGITDDLRITDLTPHDLKESIRNKYNAVLLKLGTKVHIKFTDREGKTTILEPFSGKKFDGTPLPIVEYREGDGASARFEIYARRTPHPRGKINLSFGEIDDEFSISFADFSKSVGDILPNDVIVGLGSGYFEGRMLSSSATIHPRRSKFEQDDGLISFCVLIERWFDRIGRDYLKEAQSQKRENYWQAIGVSAMKVLSNLIKTSGLEIFQTAIDCFKIGSIGPGHAKPPKGIVVGEDETVTGVPGAHQPHHPPTPAPTPPSHSPAPPSKPAHPAPAPKPPPTHDHPGHHPSPVKGPRGTKRLLVRGDSKGVHLEFVTERSEMNDPERFWELDDTRGVIRFNTYAHAWKECENEPRALARLILHSCVVALYCATLSDDVRPDAERFLDQVMKHLSCIFTRGEKLLGSFIRQVQFPRPSTTVATEKKRKTSAAPMEGTVELSATKADS